MGAARPSDITTGSCYPPAVHARWRFLAGCFVASAVLVGVGIVLDADHDRRSVREYQAARAYANAAEDAALQTEVRSETYHEKSDAGWTSTQLREENERRVRSSLAAEARLLRGEAGS